MRKSFFGFLLLVVLFAGVDASAQQTISFQWTNPTTKADGTALSDLAGSNIYRTDGTRTKLNSTLISSQTWSYVLMPAQSATFVVTAVRSNGVESGDSAPSSVTPPVTPPGTPVLVSPSGTITTPTPTYTWKSLPTATDYYLWVNDSTGKPVIQTWYTAAAACPGTSCSVTPTTALTGGGDLWWIQGKNSAGTGPWSTALAFSLTIGAPGAAKLKSPTGSITTHTPVYTWNAVSNSTWYYLWVADPSGVKIQQWYTAAQAGCASGTGTCSVTPTTALKAGACQWWIETWNNSGYGPWSAVMSFRAPK